MTNKHTELIAQLQTAYEAYVHGNHRELCDALKKASDALQASGSAVLPVSANPPTDDEFRPIKSAVMRYYNVRTDYNRNYNREMEKPVTEDDVLAAMVEVRRAVNALQAHSCAALSTMQDALDAEDAIIARESAKPPHTCTWVEDADGYYSTECGESYVFNDGTPKQNNAYFCHHCGGRLLTFSA